jgi:hypothetical protein
MHIDSFVANRDNYYCPGLLVHLVQPRVYLISWAVSYSIKGRQESQQSHEIVYHVHALHLQAEQQHSLQLDSPFDLTPTRGLNGRLPQSFRVFADTIVK